MGVGVLLYVLYCYIISTSYIVAPCILFIFFAYLWFLALFHPKISTTIASEGNRKAGTPWQKPAASRKTTSNYGQKIIYDCSYKNIMVVFMYFNKGACALNAMANKNGKGCVCMRLCEYIHKRIFPYFFFFFFITKHPAYTFCKCIRLNAEVADESW